MLQFFKRITVPYHLSHWYTNLLAVIPQIIGGFYLTFYFSPRNMGVPWSTKFNNLPAFKVSPDFIETVGGFGYIFSKNPEFFAYAACYSMFFGGIFWIIGYCIRLSSVFIFLVMLTTLLFREFDYSWSYIPTFSFLSLSILGLWFGSGRYGLDYIVAKKMRWV